MLSDKNYEYLKEIHHYGNITKAAQVLYISQPALSQFLSRLEIELGFEIFDRSKSPLELTPAGALYWDYLERYRLLKSELENNLRLLKLRGKKITLGIPFNLQPILADRIVTLLLEAFPRLELTFASDPSPMLEQKVAEGCIDFAILNIGDKKQKNLDYHILQEDRLLLVGHSSLAHGQPGSVRHPIMADLNDFKDETFILAEEGFLIREIADRAFDRHQFKPRRTLYNSNIITMLNLAAKGECLSFVTALLIRDVMDPKSLGLFCLEGQILDIPLCLVSQPFHNLSFEVRECVKHLIENYRPLPIE